MNDTNSTENNTQRGQTLVEFALILPVLLMLLFAIMDFGRILFTYAQASNALRDSLRYGAISGIDEANPHYGDCTEIANRAQQNVFFADATPIIAIEFWESDEDPDGAGIPYWTCGLGDPTPISIVDLGDRLSVTSTSQVAFLTPFLSNTFPTITLVLEGRRTLTAGGVTYGEGIEALELPVITNIVCDASQNFVTLDWTYDNTFGSADEFWIYNENSTLPIGILLVADAWTTEPAAQCTGTGSVTCYSETAFGTTTTAIEYYVAAVSDAFGVGPVSAPSTAVACPTLSSVTPVTPADVETYGLGHGYVELSWTHPDPVGQGITEYRIYSGSIGGTLEATISGGPPATTCSDCASVSNWDGTSTLDLFIVAVAGATEAVPGSPSDVQVTVNGASPGINMLHLRSGNTDDDGLVVAGRALNVVCDGTASTYSIDKGTDYAWLSPQYTILELSGDALAAGTYTLNLDIISMGNNKNFTYDIDLSVCNSAGASCVAAVTATNVLFDENAGIAGDPEDVVNLVVGAPVSIGATDRIRVGFTYISGSNGNYSMDIGVDDCSGTNNSRLEFP